MILVSVDGGGFVELLQLVTTSEDYALTALYKTPYGTLGLLILLQSSLAVAR
jgi:hypothetical protein